jgi:hypothetical protein
MTHVISLSLADQVLSSLDSKADIEEDFMTAVTMPTKLL